MLLNLFFIVADMLYEILAFCGERRNMPNNIKVSIIMPSLNVANYIEQAIESVVNQTLKDIEIICVDAGSEDGTLDIIKRMAQSDARIRLLMSDKKSYGYQMNIGVKAAVGDYIGIVETDDFVKSNMYETLYAVASENGLDFVKADYEKFWWSEDNSIYVHTAPKSDAYNCLLTDANRSDLFRYSSLNWTGIYRREYLIENDIWHSETPGASYQDIGFWLQNMSFAKRAMWIPQAFYMYRQDNPASSMKSRGKMCCSLEEYRRVLTILKERGCDVAYRECLMLKHMDYRVTFNRIDDSLKREYIEIILSEYSIDKTELASYELTDYEFATLKWVEDVLTDADKAYNEVSLTGEAVRCRLDECSRVFLYGAGQVAKRCFEHLYAAGYWDKVAAVIVSSENDQEKFFDRDVKLLDKLVANDSLVETDLIILGLGIKNQEEINIRLFDLGLDNIMSASELDSLVYVI